MTHTEALLLAQKLVAKRAVRWSEHALGESLPTRKITRNDVFGAVATATTASSGTSPGAFVLTGGVDMSEEPLTVVVAFDAGLLVVIVTAYAP